MKYQNNFFKDKSVLVTGASGTIGSHIIKFLIKKNCRVIRAFSNDENGLYDLDNQINHHVHNDLLRNMKIKNIRYLLGDVRDYKRCKKSSEDIDIIIHAAALKHVPICEYNSEESYKTNFLGTKNIIKAAIANEVKLFLFISTDKVINPTSWMGKTKLMAENFVIKKNSSKVKTKFAAIRFGNVIGSRGSVLLRFFEQIKLGKTITVTHPDMTRFFITIDSAVRSIFKSLLLMNGGEIFIIKNMKAFKILDLANSLKKLMNAKNKIIYSGIRKGEKVYEELMSKKEEQHVSTKKNFYILTKKKTKFNDKVQIKNSQTTRHLKKKELGFFLKKILI
jgi:FlaA1/EpsC-like NDP-sugar epimerase